ncbi:angiopoietin-related protein 7-like [Drosophila albomicans]|uniref:Angiopoietin-related protein 7-like n=1 Tax=Drosophila albomicans TaxID=7291 RepID=A0A6P8XU42_DROAB|nr:angiopoietin-related protein 7-like [Drosophila albomicans]
MILIANVLTILWMVSQVQSSCFAGSREMDEQCSTYCYQVVKPLLQHVNSANSKENIFIELNNKIKELEAKIVNLNEMAEQNDMQLALQAEIIALYKNNTNNYEKRIAELESENVKRKAKVKTNKDETLNDSYSLPMEKFPLEKFVHLDEKYHPVPICPSSLTGLVEIPVYVRNTNYYSCDSSIAGPGWIVMQRRIDGRLNFNRNWADYRKGFGELNGEFFMGLEEIHLLTTSQPHELYILLVDFANRERYARYSDFSIGSEEESYELKELGSYSGNAGDALRSHELTQFSTPDRDNDLDKDSCAENFRSGWWFSKCYECNLNGEYTKADPRSDDLQSIEWRTWKHKPLKFSQMMIRSKTKINKSQILL